MSYHGHPSNMYLPSGAEGMCPPSLAQHPPLHPSVLQYRQNMMPPQYNIQQPGLFFPPLPPPPPPNYQHFQLLLQQQQEHQRRQQQERRSSGSGSSGSSATMELDFLSTISLNNSNGIYMPPQTSSSTVHSYQMQESHSQSQQQQRRRPSIQDFNLTRPPHSSPPMPPLLSPSIVTTSSSSFSSSSNTVDYPRSTVETALLLSEGYEDREPGEVILNQPSASERQAMMNGLTESELEAQEEEMLDELINEANGTEKGMDSSSFPYVDGQYHCPFCLYSSPHQSNIATHFNVHIVGRTTSANKSPTTTNGTQNNQNHGFDLDTANVENSVASTMSAVLPNAVSMADIVPTTSSGMNAPLLRGALVAPVTMSSSPLSSYTNGGHNRDSPHQSTPPLPAKKSHLTLPTYIMNITPEQQKDKDAPSSNTERELQRSRSQSQSPGPEEDEEELTGANNPSSLSALNECNYKHRDTLLHVANSSCSPSLNQLRESFHLEMGALLKNVFSKTAVSSSENEADGNSGGNKNVASASALPKENNSAESSKSTSNHGDKNNMSDNNVSDSSMNEMSALHLGTVNDAFDMDPQGQGQTSDDGFDIINGHVTPSLSSQLLRNDQGLPLGIASVVSLRCRLCNYSATSMRNLEKHYKAHQYANKVCRLCGKAFERPSDLVRHRERHLRDMQLGASPGQAPQAVRSANVIERNKALKNHRCHKCPFRHENKAVLLTHIRSKHQGWYTCGLCGDSFRYVSSFALHKMNAHRTEDKNVVSENQLYNNNNNDNDDSIIGGGGNSSSNSITDDADLTFSCKKCWITFPDINKFYHHMSVHHWSSEEAMENRKAIGVAHPELERIMHNASMNSSLDSSLESGLESGHVIIQPDDATTLTPTGPSVLRVDTYKSNTLFQTELLRAEVGEDNELTLEIDELDVSNISNLPPVPTVSSLNDCKVIANAVKLLANAQLKEQRQQSAKEAQLRREKFYQSFTKADEKAPQHRPIKAKIAMSYHQKRVSELNGRYYPNLASKIAKKSRNRFKKLGTVGPYKPGGAGHPASSTTTVTPQMAAKPVVSSSNNLAANSAAHNNETMDLSATPKSPVCLNQQKTEWTRPKQEPQEDGNKSDSMDSLPQIRIENVVGNCKVEELEELEGLPLRNKFLAPRSKPDARFQCELCNYCTNSEGKFDQHMNAHEQGRLICKLCQKACIKISDLTRHWITHFPPESSGNVLHCDSCTFTHEDKESMENHMKRHYHYQNSLPCTLTDEEFKAIASTAVAPQPNKLGGNVTSLTAAEAAAEVDRLKDSYKAPKIKTPTAKTTPSPVFVEKRSKGARGRPKKRMGAKKKWENPMVECGVCLKQVYQVQLKLHMSLHHPNVKNYNNNITPSSESSMQADESNFKEEDTPPTKSQRKRGQKYLTGRKNSSGTSTDLPAHTARKCEVCNRVLCNKYYQVTHMKNKHGINYHCKGCEIFFADKFEFKEHQRTCDSAFTSPGTGSGKKPQKERLVLKFRKDQLISQDGAGGGGSDSDATIINETTDTVASINALLGEENADAADGADGVDDEMPVLTAEGGEENNQLNGEELNREEEHQTAELSLSTVTFDTEFDVNMTDDTNQQEEGTTVTDTADEPDPIQKAGPIPDDTKEQEEANTEKMEITKPDQIPNKDEEEKETNMEVQNSTPGDTSQQEEANTETKTPNESDQIQNKDEEEKETNMDVQNSTNPGDKESRETHL